MPPPVQTSGIGVCLSSRNCEIIDVQEVGGRVLFWKRSLMLLFLCVACVRVRGRQREAGDFILVVRKC